MFRVRYHTLSSLFALSSLISLAETSCPGSRAGIPLRVVQHALIVASARVNGSRSYDFLVDTGAQFSMIDPALATELGIASQDSASVDGVTKSSRAAWGYAHSVQSGTFEVSNTLVLIGELPILRAADPHIRGILGLNFLTHFDMLIDNGHHLLCLDDSPALAAAIRGEHLALAEPLGSENDQSFTKPFSIRATFSGVRSPPIRLRLDSGLNAPLLYVNPRVLLTSGAANLAVGQAADVFGQTYAVLPERDLHLGRQCIPHVVFVTPNTALGRKTAPREDGLMPTIAFRRIFISRQGNYAVLALW